MMKAFFSLKTRIWILGAAVCLLLSPVLAEQPAHRLYLMASLTQDFTIGKRVTSKSGLYLSEDRESVRHLGFHHPRMDKGDFDPRDPDTLYVAALNGVLRTRDGGQTWKITMGWDMTEPKDVKVDPFQPDTLFAALPDGIGISEDQGETWRYSDRGIEHKYTQTLAFHRAEDGVVLAGTERGIYRSRDRGETWKQVLPTSATVTFIEQSPHDSKHFIASTQADGVWLSLNGGKHWTQIHEGESGKSFHYAHFHPHRPRVLTASGWEFGLRISEDLGKTWTQVEGLKHDRVWNHAMDPDFPDRIYAALYRDTVYVTDDMGKTWEPFLFPGATIWDFLFVPNAG